MLVRLHNLSARAPVLVDLSAVTELIVACDEMETGGVDAHAQEEEVHRLWHTPGFSLQHDAWVIVDRKVQVVGYAAVYQHEEGQFSTHLLVHPDYRGRGIGTLLVWLVEDRARQVMSKVQPGMRISLNAVVHDGNQAAHCLFEREGYTAVRSYWRLIVEMDEVLVQSFDEARQGGTFKLDVMVDAQAGAGQGQPRVSAGTYSAHHYTVYEKELRSGRIVLIEEKSEPNLLLCL